MTTPDQIAEIFATYERHGWILRRILSATLIEHKIPDAGSEIPILRSDLDAAWFSRPPKHGGIAWEIRYLGEPAFAPLENLDEFEPDFESRLRSVEMRLKASVGAQARA